MNVTIIPVGMLGTNCYLLGSEGKSCAIIDPGANAPKIIEAIDAKGFSPKYILLTHGHWDHTGAVKALMEAYPEAELCIGEADAELIEDPEKSRAVFRNLDPETFIIPGATRLHEGDVLALDELSIRAVETPGHTLGGVCYLCRDVMFAGDTLFLENIGRCDLYGGNYDTMLQTLDKLVALDGDFTVYPGHGEATNLDHERAHNPYINR